MLKREHERALTLIEVVVSVLLASGIVLGIMSIEFFRTNVERTIRERSGLLSPEQVRAPLAVLRISRLLEPADRVVFPDLSAQGGPGVIQIRVPTGTDFDNLANYRWYELGHDPVRKELVLFDLGAGCGSREVLAGEIQSVEFIFFRAESAPALGGEPFFGSTDDNNFLYYVFDWSNGHVTNGYASATTLRALAYTKVNTNDDGSGVGTDSGTGLSGPGVSDPPGDVVCL